jgi:transcriptional regulator with XRE-family HTH domain
MQGRPFDPEKYRRAAALRAEGLNQREIAKEMGVTRQRVQQMLARGEPKEATLKAQCSGCQAEIVSRGLIRGDRGKVFCVPCASRKEATFGQRLKAYRLAGGMTREALARNAGMAWRTLQWWEEDRSDPGETGRELLARALGIGTEVLGMPLANPCRSGRGKPSS